MRLIDTINRQTLNSVTSGMNQLNRMTDGDVEYKSVQFRYPSRRNVKVLDNFDFKLERGKTVAFVGPSGCGKSTVYQLLLKYYHPTEGVIKLNGINLESIDDHQLRSLFAIVNQEPNLFSCSIRDNITYGFSVDDGQFTEEELTMKMIRAAIDANVHDFIKSLPDGYDTPVGDRGSQLSGNIKLI